MRAHVRSLHYNIYRVKQRPSNQCKNILKPAESRIPGARPTYLMFWTTVGPLVLCKKKVRWLMLNLWIPYMLFLYSPLWGGNEIIWLINTFCHLLPPASAAPSDYPSRFSNQLFAPPRWSSALWCWLQKNTFKCIPESESMFVSRSV